MPAFTMFSEVMVPNLFGLLAFKKWKQRLSCDEFNDQWQKQEKNCYSIIYLMTIYIYLGTHLGVPTTDGKPRYTD